MKEASSDRVAFRGDTQRDRVELDVVDLPRRGRVRVTPLHLPRAVRFEVRADWFGPPAVGAGFPATGPVDATDVLLVDDVEAARAIGELAAEQLRAARVPVDLRAIASDRGAL